jgi:uncharacterized membrane protein YuzA (DUF378 family)
MKYLNKVAYILVIVGALNWGAVGLFQMDIVEKVLGDMTMSSRLIYVLIGISAVVFLITKTCKCNHCKDCSC